MTTLADSGNFNDGVTSLREAIRQVSGEPVQTIRFSTDLFQDGLPKTISLNTALPRLGREGRGDSITFLSPSGSLTIERNSGAATSFGIFWITQSTSVAMNGLIIKGGRVFGSGGDPASYGGAGIYNDGDLKLVQCVVTGNQTNGVGGGIYVGNAAYLTLENSSVNGNQSDSDGGGLFVQGANNNQPVARIRITQGSEVRNNTSLGGRGGGIYFGNWGPGYTDKITISNAKVNDNTAQLDGGGIYVDGGSKFEGTISDSEVNGNRSAGGPGPCSPPAGWWRRTPSSTGTGAPARPGTPSRSARRPWPSRWS